ncbi:DUF3899 domain-containing protein [Bacillaceae bacterium Marseille-Q3522]|nr:DUF3899 domain-containing protein [Bacillaceae bacterium Marseille-Q3522]
MLKTVSTIVSLIALSSGLTTFLTAGSFTVLSWVNSLFILSLLLLLIGLTIMIVQGGFFWSFHRFLQKISKSNQVVQEIEGKRTGEPIPYKRNNNFIRSIVVLGMILVLFSLILSYFISI